MLTCKSLVLELFLGINHLGTSNPLCNVGHSQIIIVLELGRNCFLLFSSKKSREAEF